MFRKVFHVLLSGLFKCDRDRANRLTIKVLLTTANTIIVYFRRQKSEKLPGDETSITMVDRWHQCMARQTSEYSTCISMVYPTFFYGQLDFLSCSASFQWLREAALQRGHSTSGCPLFFPTDSHLYLIFGSMHSWRHGVRTWPCKKRILDHIKVRWQRKNQVLS